MTIKKQLLFCSFLLCLQSYCCAMNLEQATNQLSETKTYQIIDLLSPEETKTLSTMNIKSGMIQDTHLFDKSCNRSHFEDFLTAIGNDSQAQEKIAPILQKLCKSLYKNQNGDIFARGRITAENASSHSTTGWHIDDWASQCHKNQSFSQKEFRVLVNLQGEGTIFTELNSAQRIKFVDCICQADFALSPDILKLTQNIVPKSRQQQLNPGQAVVFAMNKAVHTRPDTIAPRALMMFNFEKKL